MTECKNINIRIDVLHTIQEGQILDFLKSFESKCSKIIVSREIADKTKKVHFHSTFEFIDFIKVDTIRRSILRKFPSHKGGSLSVAKVKKPVENLIYICKDGDFAYFHGYTLEELDVARSRYVKPEKHTGASLVKCVYDYIIENGLSPSKRGIFRMLIRKYADESKPVDKYYLLKVATGIHLKTSYETEEAELLDWFDSQK